MDATTFTDIFNQYYAAMCFFASRLVKDKSAAESIVQDVFVELWQKSEKYTEIRDLRVFLTVATRNRCLNYLSQQKALDKRHDIYSQMAMPTEETVLQHLFQAEVLRTLAEAIAQLPDPYRQVIQMTYEDGKTSKEISETLQISESTIRNQKARGIKLLKKVIPNNLYHLLMMLL